AAAAWLRQRARRTKRRTGCENSFVEPGATPAIPGRPEPCLPPDSKACGRAPAPRSNSNWPAGLSSSLFAPVPLVQQFAQAFQLGGINTLVFEQIEHQQFVRILKKAVQKVADFRSRGFLAADQRFVHIRTPIFQMSDMTFLVQKSDGRHVRVVGQRSVSRQ